MCDQIDCECVDYLVVHREETRACQNRGRFNSVEIPKQLNKHHYCLDVAKGPEENWSDHHDPVASRKQQDENQVGHGPIRSTLSKDAHLQDAVSKDKVEKLMSPVEKGFPVKNAAEDRAKYDEAL